MSAILGANTVVKAGLITYIPEGQGERNYDAILADEIAQGAVVFLDYLNATPGDRGYKITPTSLACHGPFKVVTKKKAAGVAKLVAVGSGFEVTVLAGDAIPGGSQVKPSATTAGRVDAYDSTATTGDAGKLLLGEYVRKAKYANSGDGNNAVGAAAAGDVIVIRVY